MDNSTEQLPLTPKKLKDGESEADEHESLMTPKDSKIPNEVFHTCKADYNLRMTPARLSTLDGKSPYNGSLGSAKKMFNHRRRTSRSQNSTQNETFTKNPGESFTVFSADSLETNLSSFVTEERAAIEQSQKKKAATTLSVVNESIDAEPPKIATPNISPIPHSHRNKNQSTPIKESNLNSLKLNSEKKNTISVGDKEKMKKSLLAAKTAIEKSKINNILKNNKSPKENKKRIFKIPISKKQQNATVEATTRALANVVISADKKMPSRQNSTMSTSSFSRRSLSFSSFRSRQVYRSTAELEKEYVSSLRSPWFTTTNTKRK